MESCSVQTASSGDEIFILQQGLSPDLVFLDIMMPGIDGLHTLERLRKASPRSKVVMLSCVKDTAKIVKAMQLGAADYVHKPLDGAAVHDLLCRCLPREEATEHNPEEDFEELPGGMFFAAGSAEMSDLSGAPGKTARTAHDASALMLHRASAVRARAHLVGEALADVCVCISVQDLGDPVRARNDLLSVSPSRRGAADAHKLLDYCLDFYAGAQGERNEPSLVASICE